MVGVTRVNQRTRDRASTSWETLGQVSKKKESLANLKFCFDEQCVVRSVTVNFPVFTVTCVLFVMQLSCAQCILDTLFAIACYSCHTRSAYLMQTLQSTVASSRRAENLERSWATVCILERAFVALRGPARISSSSNGDRVWISPST